MRQQNHACRFEEIFKTKLQASVASAAKTLRSQNRLRAKIRLFFNGLQVVHSRLFQSASWISGALAHQDSGLQIKRGLDRQFLSLRQSLSHQHSPPGFGALKSPIAAGFARKPPHCAAPVEVGNSLFGRIVPKPPHFPDLVRFS
jgi:hypothetical protein